MKKIVILLSCVFILLNGFAQENISIIPEPAKINKGQGHFILPSVITVSAGDNQELKTALTDMTERLTIPTGYHVTMTNAGSAVIHIVLNKTANPEIGDEGYQLTVTTKKVTITANQPAGIFYGVQSFLQLLPPEIGSRQPGKKYHLECTLCIDYRLSAFWMARTHAGCEPSFFYQRRSEEIYGSDGRL